jgi:hypothetical protein
MASANTIGFIAELLLGEVLNAMLAATGRFAISTRFTIVLLHVALCLAHRPPRLHHGERHGHPEQDRHGSLLLDLEWKTPSKGCGSGSAPLRII